MLVTNTYLIPFCYCERHLHLRYPVSARTEVVLYCCVDYFSEGSGESKSATSCVSCPKWEKFVLFWKCTDIDVGGRNAGCAILSHHGGGPLQTSTACTSESPRSHRTCIRYQTSWQPAKVSNRPLCLSLAGLTGIMNFDTINTYLPAHPMHWPWQREYLPNCAGSNDYTCPLNRE